MVIEKLTPIDYIKENYPEILPLIENGGIPEELTLRIVTSLMIEYAKHVTL